MEKENNTKSETVGRKNRKNVGNEKRKMTTITSN